MLGCPVRGHYPHKNVNEVRVELCTRALLYFPEGILTIYRLTVRPVVGHHVISIGNGQYA